MRIHNLLYLAFSLLLLAACASDNEASPNDNGGKNDYEGVTATVAPMEFETPSRSSLSFGASGMEFKWDSNDELTILSDVDNSSRSLYTLKQLVADLTARFDGGGFKLVKSARYYAFSKTERTNSNVNIPDKANITVDYSDQRQEASGTAHTSHLGDYDFMAATATCSPDVEDQAHFDFQHLGFTMYVKMTGLPAGKKYKKLEIYDSKNEYRKPVRTIDLSKGLDVTTGTYAPAFDAEDVQSEAYKTAPRFSLLLGENDGEGITVKDDGRLDLFVELPPVDMSDNTFVFSLVPANNETDPAPYYMKCEDQIYKRQYQAGRAYMLTGTAQPVDKFNVRLRINHDWQLGDPVSRATGDPGNMDKFEKPKFVYCVFCVGEKVQQIGEDNKYFKKIATPNDADWKTSDDKVFDTYQTYNSTTQKYEDAVLEFTVADTDKDKTKNVYFVASMENLDEIFSSTKITSSTTEAQIQGLLYSIPAKTTTESDADYQARSQSFLKNLYSTPWEKQETFIGALKDPYQDVILYHVAAKVDLKWNSSTQLPVTGDNAFIKVNNVKNSNLSLFKPTTNTFETGSYNVSAPIEEDTWLNGRQVFYLPQFATPNCKYNVKIGDKDAEDATFAPATTNGWTSWLRWLRKY